MTAAAFVLTNASTGKIIAAHLERPRGWIRRSIGLIGRSRLDVGAGLWLERCWGIHTVGVRFPLDILFLGADFRVVGFVRGVKPGRLAVVNALSKHVIELPAGTLDGADLLVGDKVRLFEA